jgi:hypothetical protein
LEPSINTFVPRSHDFLKPRDEPLRWETVRATVLSIDAGVNQDTESRDPMRLAVDVWEES